MSLDWYLVPASYTDPDDGFALIEELEESGVSGNPVPGTPEAEALAEAIIEPYGDISDSPYTSFPVDVEGPVVFVNVDTRTIDEAYRVVAAAAMAHGFHILDPQLGEAVHRRPDACRTGRARRHPPTIGRPTVGVMTWNGQLNWKTIRYARIATTATAT